MSNTVTKESDPQLHERLFQLWEQEKGERGYVQGPDGVTYKVHRPSDDVISFSPQTGLDGTYAQRSTKGIAK